MSKTVPQYLLTPGPLTTAAGTRAAMGRDWGSRDPAFIAMNARVLDRLLAIAGGAASHVCVPVQGSGTFAIEAALGTLLPREDGRTLILINGAYGRRMAGIAHRLGRDCVTYETPEDTPPDPAEVGRILAGDDSIQYVVLVHCETTTGILNPVAEIADIVAAAGRRLILDAMSSFGALPIDLAKLPCDAVVASANKCLEGVPGVAFAIIRAETLASCEANAHSVSLDLHDQWRAMAGNGQWRFTPPTQVIAALDAALIAHEAEGGVAGRGARYAANCRVLVAGLRGLGFETYLSDALQAPIIVTFHSPADPKFDFGRFYGLLAGDGYLIYPGKLTGAETFRIGCIGQLEVAQMEGVVAAVARALDVMGVADRGRRAA